MRSYDLLVCQYTSKGSNVGWHNKGHKFLEMCYNFSLVVRPFNSIQFHPSSFMRESKEVNTNLDLKEEKYYLEYLFLSLIQRTYNISLTLLAWASLSLLAASFADVIIGKQSKVYGVYLDYKLGSNQSIPKAISTVVLSVALFFPNILIIIHMALWIFFTIMSWGRC